MKITVDFDRITGRIKPMHGVGQPPMPLKMNDGCFHYLDEAGIPYSRLHDVSGAYASDMFVDVPNIFRDFDADENDPASYHFVFTDWLLARLHEHGVMPIYRLGVTIENFAHYEARRIDPPKDFGKWARICEHIIRHYNEGWADGFHYGIKYWEIWNEPEGAPHDAGGGMWKGTKQQFFELYETASKHLKKCFGDSILVGGFGACGFYWWFKDPDCVGMGDPEAEGLTGIDAARYYWTGYPHDFFKYVKEHDCPLDFFSWHSYAGVKDVVQMEAYCRRVMEKYGFADVPDMLNEWNPYHGRKPHASPEAAADVLAMMLGMQKTPVGLLAYYDARIGVGNYGGMFNPADFKPYPVYYTFMMFNGLYRLENEVFTESDDENVFVGAAAKDSAKRLLIANLNDTDTPVELELSGADGENAELLFISDTYTYTPTGKRIRDGKFVLPAHACAEIRF